MVLAELAGLVVGVIVAIVAYRASKIRGPTAVYYTGRPKEEAEVEFQFDKIFTLKLKSKGSAKAVQLGVVAILFAVAFLIVAVALRTLGLGG